MCNKIDREVVRRTSPKPYFTPNNHKGISNRAAWRPIFGGIRVWPQWLMPWHSALV